MIIPNEKQKMPKKALFYWLTKLYLILGVLALPSFFAWVNNGQEASFIPFLIVFGVPSTIYILVNYACASFVLGDGMITINKGILFRSSKTIPVKNIQNMDIQSGPVASIFNIGRLQIWTASIGQQNINQKNKPKPDGVLDLLAQDANGLREYLLKKQ
jgi:membrane protein YdbS with pleckstrin-like domain